MIMSFKEWSEKQKMISENYIYKNKSFANTLDGPNDNSIVVDELMNALKEAYPYLAVNYLDIRTTIFVLDALLNGNQEHAAKILYEKGITANTEVEEGQQWNLYWGIANHVTVKERDPKWNSSGLLSTLRQKGSLPKVRINQYQLEKVYRWGLGVKNRRR